MKEQIKWAIYLIAVGFSLLAYAHLTFATKDGVLSNTQTLMRIDQRVWEIYKKVK